MKKIHFIYPLAILFFFSLFVIIIILSLQKIGTQGNKPSFNSLDTKGIKIVNLWLGADGKSWWVDEKGTFEISDSHIKKTKKAVRLKNYKKMKSKMLFILRFNAKPDALRELLHQLSKFEINQVLVASPHDNTLKNLRSLEPRFFYSPSIKTLLKWVIYSQLYIEQVYEPKADFIYRDSNIEKLLNDRLEKEIQRRNLTIIDSTKAKFKNN